MVLLTALALGGGVAFVWSEINRPYRGFRDREVFLEVRRGMSGTEIARMLASSGVVREAWHLQVARRLPPRAVLQAGEYRFHQAASAREVVDRMRRGDIYMVTLQAPEGLNLWELAAVVEATGLAPGGDFLTEARKPDLIRDLAPEATSLEGYLFPSTYQFRRTANGREICERMTREFRRQWQAVGGKGDVHAAVTLASLVEKESGVPAERPLVASVYANRLRDGMKLDCDPTVIYAARLEGRYRGTIYQSDLQRDHPYNTYQRRGLPPGPIANPGAASIRAALRPAESSYLFFVAKGDGSGEHRFSTDLAAHNRAVQAYRDAIKTTGAAGGNSPNR
ncbi:MAG: endolytic transglycosylase MltG [Bryobacterales bacterium]|nr:endolytic transglycosylase MltG [Bryobacterales bacterium]